MDTSDCRNEIKKYDSACHRVITSTAVLLLDHRHVITPRDVSHNKSAGSYVVPGTLEDDFEAAPGEIESPLKFEGWARLFFVAQDMIETHFFFQLK